MVNSDDERQSRSLSVVNPNGCICRTIVWLHFYTTFTVVEPYGSLITEDTQRV